MMPYLEILKADRIGGWQEGQQCRDLAGGIVMDGW